MSYLDDNNYEYNWLRIQLQKITITVDHEIFAVKNFSSTTFSDEN